MAVETYTVQLERVQAAIAKIENGAQSASISSGGSNTSWTRADLATLYERETELRALVEREARGRTGRRTRSVSIGEW